MSTTITIKQIQDDTWNEAIDAAIERVRAGRTITNFAHVPSVVRALEWVWMDLESLRRDSDDSTEGKD